MAVSDIKISVVDSRNTRLHRQFIRFPHRVYAGNDNWVPTFDHDMRNYLKRRHPYYENYPAQFFIATRGEEVVGTLSVSYNHRYNESHDINTAHFFFYEVIDDFAVSKELFAAGERWAREKGAEHIMGPMMSGLSVGSGMLIEGFEYPATMTMMRYNLPYYPEHLGQLGFTKHADLFSYKGKVADIEPDPRVQRILEIVKKRHNFRVWNAKSARAVKRIARQMFGEHLLPLFGHHPENYPLLPNEAKRLIDDTSMLIDKDLVSFLMHDDDIVGFALSFPDITPAIQKSKGKLTPISILRLLRSIKRTDRITLNGIGILPKYQNLGGSAVFQNEYYNRTKTHYHMKHMEYTQIAEENAHVIGEMKAIIDKKTKAHRIFIKKA